MSERIPVKEYIEQTLTPQLRAMGLDSRQVRMVATDVGQRLASIALHWHDDAFRRTILSIGYEEAVFYDPKEADLDIRALVVVAVRNSLIEDLAASRSVTKELRLTEPVLTDSEMPAFTSAAIEHLQNGITTVGRSTTGMVRPEADLFGALPHAYPHAWHVLSQLANSPSLECMFEASTAAVPPSPPWSSTSSTTDEPSEWLVTVVSSGIDPSFDNDLVAFLNYIKDGELPYFFSDSFKGITRNADKLLRIIDFVLGHGAGVVTHNYLLTPTYASQRESPLRPFHFTSEVTAKLADQSGLSQKHKDVLAEISESISLG
ncbi:MAG TPA: hypothetical protein VMM76_25680 [Pirellulaceae bacterium]|nr:hypothetical protein [Pirellulaceae bacterium]